MKALKKLTFSENLNICPVVTLFRQSQFLVFVNNLKPRADLARVMNVSVNNIIQKVIIAIFVNDKA